MIGVGTKVIDSPVGCGIVTGFTERGLPQVNHIAVVWLDAEDGTIVDAFGNRERLKALRSAQLEQEQKKNVDDLVNSMVIYDTY